MRPDPADDLADRVLQAYERFDAALDRGRRRAFPQQEFDELFQAVVRYVEATKGSPMIHRQVASEVHGLREYLALAAFLAPAKVLAEVERLECLLFSGYDPYFEGHEPPGL